MINEILTRGKIILLKRKTWTSLFFGKVFPKPILKIKSQLIIRFRQITFRGQFLFTPPVVIN